MTFNKAVIFLSDQRFENKKAVKERAEQVWQVFAGAYPESKRAGIVVNSTIETGSGIERIRNIRYKSGDLIVVIEDFQILGRNLEEIRQRMHDFQINGIVFSCVTDPFLINWINVQRCFKMLGEISGLSE